MFFKKIVVSLIFMACSMYGMDQKDQKALYFLLQKYEIKKIATIPKITKKVQYIRPKDKIQYFTRDGEGKSTPLPLYNPDYSAEPSHFYPFAMTCNEMGNYIGFGIEIESLGYYRVIAYMLLDLEKEKITVIKDYDQDLDITHDNQTKLAQKEYLLTSVENYQIESLLPKMEHPPKNSPLWEGCRIVPSCKEIEGLGHRKFKVMYVHSAKKIGVGCSQKKSLDNAWQWHLYGMNWISDDIESANLTVLTELPELGTAESPMFNGQSIRKILFTKDGSGILLFLEKTGEIYKIAFKQ